MVLETGEPIPTAKKFDVQDKNCNLSNSDNGASRTFSFEDETETSDSPIMLADGISGIKDADSKNDITAAIVATDGSGIENAKSRRRRLEEL